MPQPFLRATVESEEFSTENLQVRKVEGFERIGSPYEFLVTVVWIGQEGTVERALNAGEIPHLKEVVGSAATLVFLESDDQGKTWQPHRNVPGIVAEATDYVDAATGGILIKLRLVPRAHRLTLVETQEIFLERTLPQIFEQKLEASGLTKGPDVEFRLGGTYPAIDFLVQYRETDLNLLQRLSEHHGISIFFEEQDGRDVLVFADKQAGFQKVAEPNELPVRRSGEIDHGVHEVQISQKVIPSVYVQMDYNYRTPQLDLTSQHVVSDAYGGGVVEYAAHYRTSAEGDAFATMRAEERRAMEVVYTAKSGESQIRAGGTLTLIDDARFDSAELLVTEVVHSMDQTTGTHAAGGGDAPQNQYRNSFKAIPLDRQFRPPRITPRPRINGMVHAVIDPLAEGAIGEFARIDDTGRYTVRFFFDTAGSSRPVSSKLLRMLQQHAGTMYGTHLPLKPGIEVLVGFVDGDPDRPIIVGAVHNPLTPSPVTSANSTMNRTKTASGILVEMKDRG